MPRRFLNHMEKHLLSFPFMVLLVPFKCVLWLDWFHFNEMDVFSIVLLGFGLAMDSFAVSITSGITLKSVRVRDASKIAVFFGLFQAGMPVLGWLAGSSLADLVSGVDHWVAFGLLSFIGGKMIYESVREKENGKEFNPLSLHVLLMFSIATSIDAFAVGVSFAFLRVPILHPVIVIGAITFSLSFLGVYAGNRFGQIFKNKVKLLGGIILIGIGVKILLEDLLWSTPF